MNIIVLGGAGKMGCISVNDLAHDERVDEVVIGDLSVENAQTVADIVNSPKVRIAKVDINEHEKLISVLKGMDACLNATVYYSNIAVMNACLKAGVHYTDMGGLFHTTRKQLELSEQFSQRGISAVLGMGSAPGTPNVQARYAADRLDTIESIRIYDGIKPPPEDRIAFTYSIPTILDEMTQSPVVFRNGEFVACEPLSEFENYWFTQPIGMQSVHLSLHSEVATLPITFKEKGVKECFFKINYWGMSKTTVDKLRILSEFGFTSRDPIIINNQEIVPLELAIELLSRYSPPISEFIAPPKNQPPEWVKEIVTEVRGTKNGQNILYRIGTLTLKGALPTGVAPAIIAIWLADGRIPPGVHPPEAAIEPEPFFEEMKRRGIVTQITITEEL